MTNEERQDLRSSQHGRPPFATDFTTTVPAADASPAANMLSARQLGLIESANGMSEHRRRDAVHRSVNPGQSRAGVTGYTLADRLNPSSRGTSSIAVLSLKGGVGKTTTTVGLGMILSASRGDRVIAVDANPDFGTLAQRGPNDNGSTVRTLLADHAIDRYSDVRRHTSQSASRLEFLGSERDPAVSEAFSDSDYRTVHGILDRFYNIIITDCGTGLTHSALGGVLGAADALVVVGSPAIDSARSALATLDWLQHHGYAHLVPGATMVINTVWSDRAPIDRNNLSSHFQNRVHNVVHIPYDDHLAEGAEIALEQLNRATRIAYQDLATAIMSHTLNGTAH